MVYFGEKVTFEVKSKVVKNLKGKSESKDAPKQIHLVNIPLNMDLRGFVTISTKRSFNIYHVNEDFLQKNPLEWAADEKYECSLKLVKSIKRSSTIWPGVL